jgi:short-subunit dehydrogenase
VLSFSEALWREAQGTGVHVSCLCPGPTASKFRERAGTGATRLSTLGTPVTSMSVAKSGYRAFQRNQRVLITGLRNRVLARMVAYMPRKTVLNIAHRLQSPIS